MIDFERYSLEDSRKLLEFVLEISEEPEAFYNPNMSHGRGSIQQIRGVWYCREKCYAS